jgi:hypothetical protein
MSLLQQPDGPAGTMVSEAADVCVPLSTLYRHLPILRPCLGPRDQALVVAACARSAHPGGSLGHLLLLTRYRLVVTSERRLLRRRRLHLNADFNELAEVAWTAEPTHGGVQLAATAVDGVREHFWIRLGDADRVWRLDALLRAAFLPAVPVPGPGIAPTARPVAGRSPLPGHGLASGDGQVGGAGTPRVQTSAAGSPGTSVAPGLSAGRAIGHRLIASARTAPA